ncbi:hypothetical protein GL218_08173 [Daldinia childiae]|uniref:uncharacterized protein n=1 Tax=Daldinia childiae TaxID=326645 RepID=UPI00144548F1|nr:uncharacterized protein GL218_08173 [Daldinia childiae]KAF3068904.1 hypothetical protein GL218_08173 [Daldinia childiae]
MKKYLTSSLIAASALALAQKIPDPLICEDTLDGSPAFQADSIPCLLRCQDPLAAATGSLLPGSVNETAIPYCQLDCVHRAASPAQSTRAPDCYRRCRVRNQGSPENAGWCMYWCVDGFGDVVEATACVPSLEFGAVSTVVEDGRTVTFRLAVSQGLEWRSWYETQTVMPITSSSSFTYSAPYRASPAGSPQSTSTSSQGGQVTQTSTSASSTESAQSTGTGTETSGEAVASPTTTAAAGRLSQVGLLGVLGAVGFWIVMVV